MDRFSWQQSKGSSWALRWATTSSSRQLESKSRELTGSFGRFAVGVGLLLHCASARANFLLEVKHFAECHDDSIWTCLWQTLGVHNDEAMPWRNTRAPSLLAWGCAAWLAPMFLGQSGGIVWA